MKGTGFFVASVCPPVRSMIGGDNQPEFQREQINQPTNQPPASTMAGWAPWLLPGHGWLLNGAVPYQVHSSKNPAASTTAALSSEGPALRLLVCGVRRRLFRSDERASG